MNDTVGAVPMKITALNDYCLQNVLTYLNLTDLASVAVSNTRFGPSAKYVFRRKYADTWIRYNSSSSTCETYINFLTILDAFGDKIRKLCVCFRPDISEYSKCDRIIFFKISEKCAKSVIELNLSFVQLYMKFTTPFIHLRKVLITDSCFTDSMRNLIQSAPNLTKLEFHNVENVFENSSFINHHMPLLEHFGNFNQVKIHPEHELATLQNFRRFINVNQQITSFGFGSTELNFMFKYKVFREQFFNEMHPNETCLDKRNFITYLMPFEPMYLRNLKHLHLRLGETVEFLRIMRHRRINLGGVPIKHIEVHIDDFPFEVVDFLYQFAVATKLQLYVYKPIQEMLKNMIMAVFSLPSIVDVSFFILNDQVLKTLEIEALDSICYMIKQRDQINHVVIGFEIIRWFDDLDVNHCEETVREYQPILFEHFTTKLESKWHVDFKTEIIDVQQPFTQNAFVLCVVLTKN